VSAMDDDLARVMELAGKATEGQWEMGDGGWIDAGNQTVCEYAGCGSHYAEWPNDSDPAFMLAACNFIRAHGPTIATLRAELAERDATIVRLLERRQADSAYIKKMDGIIEEVGGVTASCINPYEDLKRALQGQKQRAEAAESELASVRGDAGRLELLARDWLIASDYRAATADTTRSETSSAHERGYSRALESCARALKAAIAGEDGK